MGKRWVAEKKRDYYYRKAKKDNYRSRAAFKLKQIDERCFVLKPGNAVLDMGSNPGGWSQVAAELVGDAGIVIAVDLKPMDPVPGVTFIRGDVRKAEVIDEIRAELKESGATKFDVIVSDMSPNISGNYDMDQARSVELCEAVLSTADELLRTGGKVVMKVFEGDLFKELKAKVKVRFPYVRVHGPKASRASSSEIYIIAKGYHRPSADARASEAEAGTGEENITDAEWAENKRNEKKGYGF
ncbi:MAG: RlmE family RNA methyltransferase [Methanobacteriota archaeon]